MTIELLLDPYWDCDRACRSEQFNAFCDRHEADVLRQAWNEDHYVWKRTIVYKHLLSLLPPGLNAAEKAEWTGVDEAQFGRYKKGALPGPETEYRWLKTFQSQLPPPPAEGIFAALGAAAATNHLLRQHSLDTLLPNLPVKDQKRRKRRATIGEWEQVRAALLYCLCRPQQLLEPWLIIARGLEGDLTKGLASAEVEKFLAELLSQSSLLFGKLDQHEDFCAAANQLAQVDLDCEADVLRLMGWIAEAWNSAQREHHFVVRCLETEGWQNSDAV